MKARAAFDAFCKNPGPIVVGAVQGASCYGPAYEFTFILETALRKLALEISISKQDEAPVKPDTRWQD